VHRSLTLVIDDCVIVKAGYTASEMGTRMNQYIRDRLAELTGEEDTEATIARFRTLSGQGNSNGWK
jgi:ribosomal protein S24E